MQRQNKLILICGPTASGKSRLAMELARQQNGTIINADALQIYEGMPVLSSQPSLAEQHEIPHKLYASLDVSEKSSVGKWRTLALQEILRTVEEGRTPIVTGGTGMYFRALLGGLASIPPIPDEVRATVQGLYDALGEEKFRLELEKHDQKSANRIARNDRQRLMRAYEVVLHTGKPLSAWQTEAAGANGLLPNLEIEKNVIILEREALYAACDKRFTQMIDHGAIGEVQAILKRNLDPNLPAMKTLGLREIAAYLRSEISLNEAIAKAQQVTRNYAKRQLTWFRNQKL